MLFSFFRLLFVFLFAVAEMWRFRCVVFVVLPKPLLAKAAQILLLHRQPRQVVIVEGAAGTEAAGASAPRFGTLSSAGAVLFRFQKADAA